MESKVYFTEGKNDSHLNQLFLLDISIEFYNFAILIFAGSGIIPPPAHLPVQDPAIILLTISEST